MSKAVIFFAPGLEECEGLLCVDLLRRSGVEVTIAAVGGEKIVKSARSISVVADALAEELDYSAFDAAILPGGIPGVDNLKADATVRKVCTEFAAAGKVVAAICAAPSVLAAFGILQGKKATVYPGMEDKLIAAGASTPACPSRWTATSLPAKRWARPSPLRWPSPAACPGSKHPTPSSRALCTGIDLK